MAIAKAKKDGKTFSSTNQIEFPVVDISDCMGWDSGLVKRELKSLSWNVTSHGNELEISLTCQPQKYKILFKIVNIIYYDFLNKHHLKNRTA